MTNEEIKTLLLSEQPVECDGIIYRCIHGVIYRKNQRRGLSMLVELQDMNRNSVTIASPKRVNLVEELSKFTGKAIGGAFDEESQSNDQIKL